MKIFFKTAVGIVLFIILFSGVMTVLRNLVYKPSTILTSTECDPPCWYDIQPGKSNSSQVYTKLKQINGVNQYSILGEFDRNNKLTRVYWFFERPAVDSTGSVYFDNDRVTAISILTISSLQLADVFNKLGEPDQYWKEIGHGDDRDYVDVMLIYPTKGYLVETIIDFEGEMHEVEIKNTTSVFRVTYFDPALFDKLLETRILIEKPVGGRTGSLQPWPGLGAISIEDN